MFVGSLNFVETPQLIVKQMKRKTILEREIASKDVSVKPKPLVLQNAIVGKNNCPSRRGTFYKEIWNFGANYMSNSILPREA